MLCRMRPCRALVCMYFKGVFMSWEVSPTENQNIANAGTWITRKIVTCMMLATNTFDEKFDFEKVLCELLSEVRLGKFDVFKKPTLDTPTLNLEKEAQDLVQLSL